VLVRERAVDQLDEDATVLHGLDAVGDLQKFWSGGQGIGKGADINKLVHASRLSAVSMSVRATVDRPSPFKEKEPPSVPPGGSISLLAVIPPAQVRTAVTLLAAMCGLFK
jgi:hypothetical protein